MKDVCPLLSPQGYFFVSPYHRVNPDSLRFGVKIFSC